MKELKFRVWCKRTQEYHTPIDEEDYDADGENIWLQMCIDTNGRLYFIETSDENVGFEYVTNDCEIIDSEDAKDFIVEQYTGLKDKNSKEIYEGDIVRQEIDCGDSGDKTIIGRVTYVEEEAGFFVCTKNDNYYFERQLEIIGNIHENPELLEEKK